MGDVTATRLTWPESRAAYIAAADAAPGFGRVRRPSGSVNPDRIMYPAQAKRMSIAGIESHGAIRVPNGPALDHFFGARERRQNREKF